MTAKQTGTLKMTKKKKESAALARARGQLERLEKRLSKLENLKNRLSFLSGKTERQRAILDESIDEWIAEYREKNEDRTDGIAFEDLHVDFLMLDEAQNMKNLWPVERREGGEPKYLGAIGEASDRAMSFALRSFLTQRQTGGSGVALLSATPAKNSPLEFFTMLGLVDHYAWTRKGITDAESFIDRYLRIEMKSNLKPDGTLENRAAVVGFRALNDMRDGVYRYGDFKDAIEVGLKLPESTQQRVFLPMDQAQKDKYKRYRDDYERIVTGRVQGKERYEALSILTKMALVALHPELDEPPSLGIVSKKGKEIKKWTWENADQVRNPESPKLREAARLVLEKLDCGHIFFVENVAVHKWLRAVLIAAGIRAERIAVLNADQAPTPLMRQEIAEAFNGTPAIYDDNGAMVQEAILPKFDVVICNSVAYEGIDLQIRTCRVYHLDLPWEPATIQQRNGRAVRQGNMSSVIEIYYLLSDKSMDGVRLSLITGKLRWMADILKGTDRETANPAAGMDLSQEDLLMMLADDPEAARKALVEIQERNELIRREQAADRAWVKISELLSYLRMALMRDTELERELARQNSESTADYLRAVPPDIWPWGFLVDLIKTGVAAQKVSFLDPAISKSLVSRVVWEGLVLPSTNGRFVYFAAFLGGYWSYRWSGSHVWTRTNGLALDKELMAALDASVPASYQTLGFDDGVQWRASLTASIDDWRYRRNGWDELRLSHAPDYWRVMIWDEFGVRLVAALASEGRMVPVRVAETVEFRSAAIGDFSSIVPPTNGGYAELIQRVKQGRHRFGVTDEATKSWWGREFPKGVADDREIVVVGSESYRLETAYNNGRAVAQVGELEWRIFVLEDVVFVGPTFTALETAKLALRWLGSLGHKSVLDGPEEKLLRWLAVQSELPTLTGLGEIYQRGNYDTAGAS